MTQAERVKVFEDVLLSYVEVCYAVAHTLTRNPKVARDLTREVMTWAWQLRESADAETNIKNRLLSELRARFKKGYRRSIHGRESGSPYGKGVICIVPYAERSFEKVSAGVQSAMRNSCTTFH